MLNKKIKVYKLIEMEQNKNEAKRPRLNKKKKYNDKINNISEFQ